MGTCLALHRVEPDRLAEIDARALEAAARLPPLGLRPPYPRGPLWSADRLRDEYRFRPWRKLFERYNIEVGRPWLEALNGIVLDTYDLDKQWNTAQVLTRAGSWAGEWLGAPANASPISRAFFGTHLPPDSVLATLDFPVRSNAPRDVRELLPGIERFDLQAAWDAAQERGESVYREYADGRDHQLLTQGYVNAVVSMYHQAAGEGQAVVAWMY